MEGDPFPLWPLLVHVTPLSVTLLRGSWPHPTGVKGQRKQLWASASEDAGPVAGLSFAQPSRQVAVSRICELKADLDPLPLLFWSNTRGVRCRSS